MKRVATIAFYAIGVLAILYLALYAYVTFTGREFEPGDPIHIFRKPDAPNYSWGGHLEQPQDWGEWTCPAGSSRIRAVRKLPVEVGQE
jgi:hypothetical protein